VAVDLAFDAGPANDVWILTLAALVYVRAASA